MADDSDVSDENEKYPGKGTASIGDPALLARKILSTCGVGRILVVGSGTQTVVRELLKQGADAQGVEASPIATAHGNSFMPGRFHTAPMLALPFPDASFEVVVSTGGLEHPAVRDITPALLELHRVCRRSLFLCARVGSDGGGRKSPKTRDRGWWEEAAFAAGFRKHPHYYQVIPFHALELEDDHIAIPLEKIPPDVLSLHPLSTLIEHRNLRRDMSRETGRQSDAHMARYHLATNYIREGDTVLDAACGMGDGSHLLVWQSLAASVIGTDLDDKCIRYASENFSEKDGRISFRVADAQHLSFLPDNSVDVFISFGTLAHVLDPEQLIAEAKRVLRPSGRFIASVPNLRINEEGMDPNSHHLHVYDWGRLAKEVQSHFMLEAAYAQTAGGGMKLGKKHRSLFEFPPEGKQPVETEWWLVVGMKDPVESKSAPYKETALRWKGVAPNAVAFARDYENPWLIRGIVSIGWRNRNLRQRTALAERALAASSASSPDTGAALCVLAYGLLESPDRPTPASVSTMIVKIDTYVDWNDPRPQFRRWAISLMYVRGLLWQSIGELGKSLDSFRNCAAADPLVYSPLLATKTVDACRLAGMLSLQAGNKEGARAFWTRGISLAEQALRGNWREIYGDIEHPFTFGLREAAQILDIASRCADSLHHLEAYVAGRGLQDDGSFAVRLRGNDEQLEKIIRDLTELRSSPGVRLQKALQNDPKSFRGVIRIFYLLAVVLVPTRLKAVLRPISTFLRQKIT